MISAEKSQWLSLSATEDKVISWGASGIKKENYAIKLYWKNGSGTAHENNENVKEKWKEKRNEIYILKRRNLIDYDKCYARLIIVN